MDKKSTKKYDWLTKFLIDTDRLDNPNLPVAKQEYTPTQKFFGWVLLFVTTHSWWISAAFVLYFCEGAIGVGYRCTIPIEDWAFFTELSTIFFGIPLLLPLLFYFKFFSNFFKKINTLTFILGSILLLVIIFNLVSILSNYLNNQ